MSNSSSVSVTPMVLRDTPALIEAVFPAQKVSCESQTERKAVQSQTLTGLGSYWKGRKPLVLVRSIVLGCLLPQTNNPQRDLEIFEKLLAIDEAGLAKRALAANSLKPNNIAACINLDNPWHFFQIRSNASSICDREIEEIGFPLILDDLGITISWRKGLSETDKLFVYSKFIHSLSTYEEKAALCKRAEEVDQTWLYEDVWPQVKDHYRDYGVEASSHQALIEQLGVLRYGKCPKVGDSFSGGGSIPFEAARLGCDVYAADLNPIASMLTWGALDRSRRRL